MPTTCAAAFSPRAWTYASAPRKTEFSEFASLAGLPVPALPFAQRLNRIAEGSPPAKGSATGGLEAWLPHLRRSKMCLRPAVR